MNQEMLVNVVDVIDRHAKAMLTELRAVVERSAAFAESGPTGVAPLEPDVLEGWKEIERLTNQTYSWPADAGGTEEYDPFILYQSGSRILALAHNLEKVVVKDKRREQVWVFQMGAGRGSKRPITPFIAADDFADTGEMVAIMRGKGETGRAMFEPGDELPPEYDNLKVETLGDRIRGHYRRLCVVAHKDDTEPMLRHGAAQIRLRGF